MPIKRTFFKGINFFLATVEWNEFKVLRPRLLNRELIFLCIHLQSLNMSDDLGK